MKTSAILAIVGVIVLLIALVLPWIAVNAFGLSVGASLGEMYGALLEGLGSAQANYTPDISSLSSLVSPTMIGILATLILYPVALIVGIVSVKVKKLTIAAGVLAIITGILWIVGIEGLKSTLASLGSVQGIDISSMIGAGYGTYLAIISGVIFFVAFFVRNRASKTSYTAPPPPPPTPAPAYP